MRRGHNHMVEEHRGGRTMRLGDPGMNPVGIFLLPHVRRRVEGEESPVDASLAMQ